MTTKTGLMFHPHKKEVHFGKMNAETGIRIGDPINVTGDFLGILPEMFKINTISKVEERDGSTAYHAALFDDELAATVTAAPALLKAAKDTLALAESVFSDHLEGSYYYDENMAELQPLRDAIAQAEVKA